PDLHRLSAAHHPRRSRGRGHPHRAGRVVGAVRGQRRGRATHHLLDPGGGGRDPQCHRQGAQPGSGEAPGHRPFGDGVVNLEDGIRAIPKAELHLHIEGTLEPDLMFDLASSNGVELPFPDVEAVRAAYRFTDLQSFLDIYYRAAAVLQTRDDSARLMAAYLDRAAAAGVVHAEIFFDPQTHTERGIGFEVFMNGFRDAMADAHRTHGITSNLILCFLRHLSPEDAVATIRAAEDHLEGVVAVGLDSSESGFPPEPFAEAYEIARSLGLRAVAHAGEEGP